MSRAPIVRSVGWSLLVSFALTAAHAAQKSAAAPAAYPATIAGGLLELPPDQPLGRNVISNANFQSDSGWKLPQCWSIDKSTGHDGGSSLRYQAGGDCSRFATTDISRPFGSARSYTLRFWMKGSAGTDVAVKFSLHDLTDRQFVLGGTKLLTASGDWQQVVEKDIDILPLHDGHDLQLRVVAQGSTGTVWFSNLELVEQLPYPLSVFLLYPNFRGYLWSDGPQQIRLQTEVNGGEPKSKVRLVLKAEDGREIKRVEQPAERSAVISIDGSTLLPGPYRVESSLVDASGKTEFAYPAYRVAKVTPQFRASLVNYIDPDNYLVREGKRRFVWGVYDRFSTHRCRGCMATDQASYEQIPGFDNKTTIQNYAECKVNAELNIVPFSAVQLQAPKDQLTPWLAALDKAGVGHLQLVNNWVEGHKWRPRWAGGISDDQLWHMLANAEKGKPGALGYATYDEPESTLIPQVFAQSKILREGNPGTVTYGTLVNARQVFRWRDVSDVLSADPYPIGSPLATDDVAAGASSAPAMLRISSWTREVVRQSYNARPVWMVVQLFRHANQFPSYDQMRMQAYKAIINGAHGVMWWGFVSAQGIEGEVFKRDNSQGYHDFKRVSQEVMTLEPVLISNSRPGMVSSVSNQNIEYLVKADSEKAVIFASNYSENSLGSVTFKLGSTAPAPASIEVYSENRSVKSSGHSFSDSFGPYEVHVYVLPLRGGQ